MTGNGQPGVLQVLSTSRLAKYNYLQTGVCDTYVWAVGEKRRGGGVALAYYVWSAQSVAFSYHDNESRWA